MSRCRLFAFSAPTGANQSRPELIGHKGMQSEFAQTDRLTSIPHYDYPEDIHWEDVVGPESDQDVPICDADVLMC